MSSQSINSSPSRPVNLIFDPEKPKAALISLVLKYLPTDSHLDLALYHRAIADVVIPESARHASYQVLDSLDGLIDGVNRLRAESDRQSFIYRDENEHLEAIIGQLEEAKMGLKTVDDLDGWLRQLRQKYSGKPYPAPLIKELRAFVQEKQQEKMSMFFIISHVAGHIKNRVEENKALRAPFANQWFKFHQCADKIREIRTNAEAQFQSAPFQALNSESRRKVIDRIRFLLVEKLKEFPPEILKGIADRDQLSQFMNLLKKEMGAGPFSQLKKRVEKAGLTFNSLTELKEQLNALMQEKQMFPEGILNLDQLLAKIEISQFRGVNSFDTLKGVWIGNLISLADENQRSQLEELWNDQTIRNSDDLFKAFLDKPELLSFLAHHVVNKLQVQMRETAFVDVASIPMLKEFSRSNDMEYYTAKISSLPSHVLMEKAIENRQFLGEKTEQILQRVISYLLSYELPEKAAQVMELFPDHKGETAHSHFAIINYYLKRGDRVEARQAYVNYLKQTGQTIRAEMIAEALELGVSLHELSRVIIGKNDFGVNNQALANVVNLLIEKNDLDQAMKGVQYMTWGEREPLLGCIACKLYERGDKQDALTYCIEAFSRTRDYKDAIKIAEVLSQNSALVNELRQREDLEESDKLTLELALAERVESEEALEIYERILSQILPLATEMKGWAVACLEGLVAKGSGKKAINWIAQLKDSSLKNQLYSKVFDKFLENGEGEREALRVAKLMVAGRQVECLNRLIGIFIPGNTARAIEIAKLAPAGTKGALFEGYWESLKQNDIKSAFELAIHLDPDLNASGSKGTFFQMASSLMAELGFESFFKLYQKCTPTQKSILKPLIDDIPNIQSL